MGTRYVLRDQFAMAALAGGLKQGAEDNMAAEFSPSRDGWWQPADKIARRAYEIADAMLKLSKQ